MPTRRLGIVVNLLIMNAAVAVAALVIGQLSTVVLEWPLYIVGGVILVLAAADAWDKLRS